MSMDAAALRGALWREKLRGWLARILSMGLLIPLLGLAGLGWGVVGPYFTEGSYNYQDARVRRDLAGEFDVLISGSSQALRAIDPLALDRAMDCRSYNLGMVLQTMYGRYQILERELERNPVSLVVIELAYDTLGRTYEDNYGFEGSVRQLGRLDHPGQWLDYVARQVPPRDWVKLLDDTLDRAASTWALRRQNGPYVPFQYETHGFIPGLKGVPMPDAGLYEADYHKESLPTNVEEENLYYLDRCLELCRERGVEAVLIVTPLSEYMLWNCDGFDEILATHRGVSEKWGVPLYDFNLKKDKLSRYSEETAYCDQHHLCEAGAQVFTGDLADILLRARAGEDVSGEFYTTYDEAIHSRRIGG